MTAGQYSLRKRFGPLSPILLVLAVAGVPGPASGEPSAAARGIDVSHYSGAIDWSRLEEAGTDFVYVKATEGVDAPDPSFDDHWKSLADTDLLRGAYHFYVTEDDPEEQARLFLEHVQFEPGDLAPAVDVEVLGHGTSPGLADRLRRFLDIVEKAAGVKPIIYTSPNFWDAHLDGSFAGYPLWVAEYGVGEPRLPRGWTGWALWQWKDDHETPGVEKDADHSVLHPALDLERLRIPGPR